MRIRIVALILVLFTVALFSQTTGVIRGVVLDEMGDPLPGANIVVIGTTWGAETDEDGYYYIIGVRAGTYTIRAQFIGFMPREVQDVRVRVGLTATQNFKMSTEVMELAEIGVEVAMEKKVEMDVTTSSRTVDMGSMENLAVTQVDDLLKQTAGVQSDAQGDLHFRGGRGGEVSYVLDGVSVGDPTGAKSNPVEINFANIESFSIQKGVPDAEYGDALSGSVNIVMRIGDQEKTSGHVKYATDSFLSGSKFNYDRGEFSLSGPIPLPISGMKPTYYFATDFTLQDGFGRSYRKDGDPNKEYFEFKEYDLTGFGFEIPQRRVNNFNLIFRGGYDLSLTQKLNISYTKSRTNATVYNYYYRYTPQTAVSEVADVTIFNMNWRHTINQQSYYDLVFSYYNRQLERMPGGKRPDEIVLEDKADKFETNIYFPELNNDINRNGVRDGGDAEGYIDTNQNGYFDREYYVDNSGSGFYSSEAGDVFYPFDPAYDHNMNGVWDGDILFDFNKNGEWDYWEINESFTGFAEDVFYNHPGYHLVEGYYDISGTGHYTPNTYIPINNMPAIDEPFIDGDSYYDTGEPFIDQKRFEPRFNKDSYASAGKFVSLPNMTYDDDSAYEIALYKFIYPEDDPANGEVRLDDYMPDNFDAVVEFQRESELYGLKVFSPTEWYPPMSPPRYVYNGYNCVIRYKLQKIEYQAEKFLDLRSSGGSLEQPNPVSNGIYNRPNEKFDEYEAFCKPRPYTASVDYDNLGWVSGYEPGNNSGVVWYVGSYIEYKATSENYQNTPNLSQMEYDQYSTWKDWNKNGRYDKPNDKYDTDELITVVDYNNNGEWDQRTGFLPPDYYLSGTDYSLFDNTVMKLKGNYTNQISRYHMIKTGFEFTMNDLDYYRMTNPWRTFNPDDVTGYPENDPYPDRGTTKTIYQYEPKEFSAYLQDKMEFEDLVVNVGIRYDMRVLDQKAVDYYEEQRNVGELGYEEDVEKFKFVVSPRFGISHAISESSKLFFSYGHLYQLPNYTLIFDPNTKSGDNPLFGNMNLGYERNVQYELGVVNEVGDYLIDITGYFKDIYDMVATKSYQDGIFSASTYFNADYGKTRGIELTVDRSLKDRYMWGVTYTLSYAYGKSSSLFDNYDPDNADNVIEIREFPLIWDERHSANTYFTLIYAEGDKLFGINYLDNWTFGISSDFGSGKPFSPTVDYYGGEVAEKDILTNSERLPWTSNTDMKLTKAFVFRGDNDKSLGRLKFEFDIYNVFNKTNVLAVYSDTGTWDKRSEKWYEDDENRSNMVDIWKDPSSIAEKRHFRFAVSYLW